MDLMENQLIQEDVFKFKGLIEKFAFMKEKYCDQYPVIIYEPEIKSPKKKALRELAEGNESIHLFSTFKEGFDFVQQLGIGFILITSSDFDKKVVLKNFQGLPNTFGREMLDFEEKALFEDLFEEDQTKSLQARAYVFFTLLEFKITPPKDENEEEVMMMKDLKSMANEFRQEFSLIWYDPNPSVENKEMLEKEVDLEEKNIHTNFDELRKRILDSGEPPFHLILTGKTEIEKIVQEIKDLQGLLCLYIYYDSVDITKVKHPKIIAGKNIEELIPEIINGVRTKSVLINTFPAFATHFDAYDKSDNFNLHYYLQGLTNFKNRRQAKRDFVNLAKKIYHSKRLFEFDDDYYDYDKAKILTWYTKESPVYKLLNNCLRIATSDSILYCRFLLKDMERAIREQYEEASKDFNGLVYRGAYITEEEWDKLQDNIGKEIEMYGFLSTSKDIETAKNFLCSDLKNKVLITIIVPPFPRPELNEQGFADISQISKFGNESEILFNVRSKFRILELGIKKLDNKGKECRHLALMYGTDLLRKSMTENPFASIILDLSPEIKCVLCGSVNNLFGFEQAEETRIQCMKCFAKQATSKNWKLLALNKIKESGRTMRIFKGKFLAFRQIDSFPYYGYRCHSCQAMGKDKYCKWLCGNGVLEQCLDCFEAEKKIENDVLILEEYPYSFWKEEQAEWERIDNSYQRLVLIGEEFNLQSLVFLEVQNYELCTLYGETVIQKIKRKRCREFIKFSLFDNLARASEGLGNHQKTKQYFKKYFKVLKLLFEDDHPAVARVSRNIAIMYWKSAKYQKALEHCNKALEIEERIYGKDYPQAVESYKILASIYSDLNENQKALEFHEKTMHLAKIFFGEKHPDFASSVHNFAAFLYESGEYQLAQKYFEEGLETRKNIFGEIHPTVGISYLGLGSLSEDLGQYQKALDLYRKALSIYKNLYGKIHPDIVKVYNSMTSVFHKLRKSQQALKYHQKALRISKAIDDKNASDRDRSNYEMATLLAGLIQSQKGLSSQKDLDTSKAPPSENHSTIAATYSDLAKACFRQNEFQKAIEYYEKSINITREKFGEQHPSIAAAYCSLAGISLELKNLRDALSFSKKALKIREAFYGEGHLETAISYDILGRVLQKLGEYREALKFFHKYVEIQKALFGEEAEDMAFSYHSMAEMYKNANKFYKAIEYYQKFLKIRIAISGENNPSVINSYRSLALVYFRLRRYKKAIQYLQKALFVAKVHYGEDHSEVDAISAKISNFSQESMRFQNTIKWPDNQFWTDLESEKPNLKWNRKFIVCPETREVFLSTRGTGIWRARKILEAW